MEFYTKKDERIFIKSNSYYDLEYKDGGEMYLENLFSSEKLVYDYKYPIELLDYIKDYTSNYHLSVKRFNIIEAFIDLIKSKDVVLELGAGTGAVTGILSHYFNRVDTVEGSLKRAEIIKKRLKNRDNINIYVDDILDFEYKKNYYDFVTMIGVLEYIPYYKDINSIQVVLSKIKESLNDNGIFLLAIENKFGAKYFAGCREDHNAQFFTNLMGYPFKSPMTFSKKELEYFLKRAGFENYKFYFAFPDYKFTNLVIKDCDEFFDIKPSGLFLYNFDEPNRMYLFSDVLFLENIIKSGEISTFANSFVILASKNKDVCLDTDWITKAFFQKVMKNPLVHHTAEIKKVGNSYKIFKKPIIVAGGVKYFKKSKVIFDLENHEKDFIHGGENLLIKAIKIFFSGEKSKLVNLISDVNRYILENFSTGKLDKMGFPLVKGVIDCTLWNLIEKEGRIYFFDRKWFFEEELPIDFLLTKSIVLGLYPSCKPFLNSDEYSFCFDIISNIYKNYNYSRYNFYKRKSREFFSILEQKKLQH